ncbi:hypothetical protein [Actinoplanes friuliensis]|uniref:Peptidase MA-like domain-containing protein n=1 Tax=Actinoplanes friuliensis DSM 7358 TaxID=1246995 RepID=U5VP53_9ACTN|nr:hypothetical protein [Actinoplanes friuliensis]AGZ38577.1 hypothetical protein AFR_01440 [Actinoplanes friuliensis DSM 7358]
MHDAEEFPAPPTAPSTAQPTAPAIPQQRGPSSPIVWYSDPAAYTGPATFGAPIGEVPPVRRRRRGLLVGGALTLVAALAIGAGVVYVVNRDPLAEKAVAAAVDAPAKVIPATPFEAANATLKAQADALLRGDEKGWLAALDPGQSKLLTTYRSMFRSLRGLGVNHFTYDTSITAADKKKKDTVGVLAHVEYCFSSDKCPEEKYNQSDGPPTIKQELVFKSVKGRWLITGLTAKKSRDEQQPTPWESGDLVIQQGKRVTLIGNRTERKYFKQVLPIAEKAAAVNDRFAGLVGNPQKKYRIYLAGAKQWKTWYGGITDKWVIGYAMPLSDSGSDVVLNIRQMSGSRQILESTIQHELGHVVTLSGAYRTGGRGDMWLEEGIAEYIGWYPKPATASWRRSAVSSAMSGSKRPKTIAPRGLADNAGPDASDAFYGLGHFAADCMARKYGQSALFTFVRLYLRENRDLDPAAREAFGRSFASVDKACIAWIRDKA